MNGPRALRSIAFIGALSAVCLVAIGAVTLYRTGRAAAVPFADVGTAVWLGPKNTKLRKMSASRLRSALATLDDPLSDPTGHLRAYEESLAQLQPMLRRAILADLADTEAIQQLAAVHWELGVLSGNPDREGVAGLVGIAGDRAPHVAEIQVALGEILYKLGSLDDANPFMSRAISLSESMASRVVTLMIGAGLDPAEIVKTLPPAPEVLVAIAPEFSNHGRGKEFLPILEARLGANSPRLLQTYGDNAIALGEIDRLNASLNALGRRGDAHLEAERQMQLGQAAGRRNDWKAAYEFHRRAWDEWPADPRFCEAAAYSALYSDRLSDAEEILRNGLARVALLEGTNGWRARFYRGLGEIYERMGKGDDALAFYRRALEQDPNEYIAHAKVAQIDSLLRPKVEAK